MDPRTPFRRLIRTLPAWAQDPNLWFPLVVTLTTLVMAWTVKAPCVLEPWHDDSQYKRLCYNDIQPLYSARSMHEDVVPYVGAPGTNGDGTPKGFIEYPTLTGLAMYLAALVTDDGQPGSGNAYFIANAVLLALFALGTTVALYFAVDDKRRVLFWAAGSPLAIYAFHNWDVIAVFFGSLGLTLFLRGRYAGSGVAIAAGASAKLFPLFFAPFLGLWLLRRDRGLRRDGLRFGVGFLGGALAINGPFLLANPSLFLRTYTFHLERGPNFETLWYVLDHYGRKWGLDWMAEAAARETLDKFGPLVLLGLLSLLGVLVVMGRLDPVPAALGGMLVFLLLNKVFSVQYAVWVLPLFVLVRVPAWKYLGFITADASVYITVFTFFDRGDAWFDDLARSVVARSLAIAVLLAHVFWMGLRRHTARTHPVPGQAPARERVPPGDPSTRTHRSPPRAA